MTMSGNRYEPLFDVHPVTGASIEVFFADRRLATFGRGGAGWFWWLRRRGSRLVVLPKAHSLRATQLIGTRWLAAF